MAWLPRYSSWKADNASTEFNETRTCIQQGSLQTNKAIRGRKQQATVTATAASELGAATAQHLCWYRARTCVVTSHGTPANQAKRPA